MKIYTRSGDKGSTALFAGGRVSKSHLRVEAYGTVDELNSYLGLIRSTIHQQDSSSAIDAVLERIQNELFILGADLATPFDAKAEWLQRLPSDKASALEADIDSLDADLDPLTAFILPGGTPAAAHSHVARTICRRAERRCVALAEAENINEAVVPYLNRLSDYLFTLARWLNKMADEGEVRWQVREQ